MQARRYRIRQMDESGVLGERNAGLFGDFYEQPILNYFVHSMTQRGQINTTMSDLQRIGGHHGVDELKQDCARSNWHFPKHIQRSHVAHFCGRKPFLFDRKAYCRPFTIARLEHHRRRSGEVGAQPAVLKEESPVLANKVKRRLWNLVAR
jgi:hypothetical protein